MSETRPPIAAPARPDDQARYGGPGGPWDVPVLDEALSAPLASAPAGRALVVDGPERLDGVALEAAVAAVAGGLVARGVASGDVIAWQLPNGAAAVVLFRACWRVGAIAVPLHHRAGPPEVAGLVERVEPALVVVGPDHAAPDVGATPVCSLVGSTALALRAALDGPPHAADASGAAPGDVAVVLFTSGSTGRPKGVLHTHRALVHKARTMAGVHGLGTDDVVLVPTPLAHVSGLLNGVLVPGVVPFGAVLVDRWDAARGLAAIEAEGVSFMVGPPTFFVGLLDALGAAPERARSLRLVSCGGAGVSEAFAREAAAGLGCVVKRTYGSTEAPTVTTSTPSDPPEAGWSTEGRPVGAAEVRISTGGEVQVRGPEVLAGYLDPEDDEGVLLDGGWFRTGDRGMLDPTGRLVVTGRLRDLIIRGGENVEPIEVEALLEAHPAVRTAVVVGVADRRLGERVAAAVEADGPFSAEDCRSWFTEQGVARHKVPEVLAVVDHLPLLPAGKPDRAAVRALFER